MLHLTNDTTIHARKNMNMRASIGSKLLLLIFAAPGPVLPFSSRLLSHRTASNTRIMASGKEYYRADGVKIDFDPYAPGMAEKYGLPGNTDPEG